jgi:type II secretory pathway pseudopilin PulG
LVELLVALVIAGILTAVVFQLLQSQGQFARLESAREEVQQNARAAVEIIGSELRGLGPGRTLEIAGPSSIRYALPRAWGIVCGLAGAEVVALFPTAARQSFRSGSGSELVDRIAVRSEAGEWTLLKVRDGTGANLNAAQSRCSDPPVNAVVANDPASTSPARYFENTAGVVLDPAAYPPGSRIYVFDWVEYDAATSSTAPGVWVRRKSNDGTPQPMAGPVERGSGLRFSYFDNLGIEVVPATEDERSRIASVRVAVTMHSQARFRGTPQDHRDSTTIFLRNRLCTAIACD